MNETLGFGTPENKEGERRRSTKPVSLVKGGREEGASNNSIRSKGREEGVANSNIRHKNIPLGPHDILVLPGNSVEVLRGQGERAVRHLREQPQSIWVHATGNSVPQAISLVGRIEKEIEDLQVESFTSTREGEFGQQGPRSESAMHVKLTLRKAQ